jgi:RES domain-containing protein
MSPHPESARLIRAMKRCLERAIEWSGVVYRSADVSYANKDDVITGIGSKRTGARWNAPNSFRTVYVSLDLQTALEESLAHCRYYELPLETITPRVFIAIRLRLQRILDLTQGEIRNALKISLRRLLEEPWREPQRQGQEALTQALGRVAYDGEGEGLLVPSAARRDGRNLVFFPANLLAGSWMEIINRAALPPAPPTENA